jgi:iron complex transport system ATP-binding protein
MGADTQATPDGQPQGSPAAIQFEAASFAYGEATVLRDISLRVAAGEMVGLLGPNGAGKSTLLKLASGVMRPQGGRVLLGAQEAHRLARAEAARRVAVVPQEFAVQFAYTVRQLVELGRTAHLGLWGVLGTHDRAAVQAALSATSLTELAERIYNELSGGERQRVLVAMALAQTSEMLLLDEPTAHLDIRHQVEVLDLLRGLNQERGLTVIAAMHDLNLAARYFRRLVLLRRGVVADGPPTAVLDGGLLAAVYQTPVRVGILRGEEHLSILPPGGQAPVPEREGTSPPTDVPAGTVEPNFNHSPFPTWGGEGRSAMVHMIAGGGSGELAMRALADAGILFSAGALNVGDSDAALATRLAVGCITEPPYAPVSDAGAAAVRAHMAAVRAVVVCPAPVGEGNVALLEAALEVARGDQIVLLLEPGLAPECATLAEELNARVRERDFTGGRAVATYMALLAAGAQVVGSPAALVEALLGVVNASLTHEDLA